MATCPKCRGEMTQGFAYSPDSGARVKWIDGEPGTWKSFKSAMLMQSSDLHAMRCGACGFVEFYVDTRAKPVRTLRSVDEENAQLRNLLTKLQDRVANLETIATDPDERTAREIEALREPQKLEGRGD